MSLVTANETLIDLVRSAMADLYEAKRGPFDDPRDPAFLVQRAIQTLDELLTELLPEETDGPQETA